MRQYLGSTAILFAILSVTCAEVTSPSSSSEFEDTTARGRLVAEYQTTVENAAKAIKPLKSPEQAVLLYIAKKTDTGWHVAAGRLSQKRDAFLISYGVTQKSSHEDYTVNKYDVPAQDSGFYCIAAKAIGLALGDFQGRNRLYNTVVLPAHSNGIFVYILPAQTTQDLYLLGGDVRYLVSGDGSNVLEKHQMHNAIIEFKGSEKSRTPAAGVHSHVLTDDPEDSDVSYVLSRKPSVPEFIKTRNHMFVVQVDGTITRKQ
jgi:hypothetical protein